ncbi:MAG: D-glycero-beta-D-manno-heptose-7-phosphate kinase [Candidatus Omnitrophota bacterium]
MSNLKNIINKFNKARILVIGDLILDEYIWGDVERISPEAPVPVVWANKRTYVPGGAANVANNICSLSGKACLAGVTGDDHNQGMLLKELKSRKIATDGLLVTAQRHTTVKTRIIARHQQVVRVDWEHTEPLPKVINQRLFKFVQKNISKFDAIIIEDYGKGVINPQMLEGLIFLANSKKKIVTVDPKEENFSYYRQVTSMTPNRRELEFAIRDLKLSDMMNKFNINKDKLFSDKDIDLAAGEIMKFLDVESILVTLGENGMRLFEKNNRSTHIPTVAQQVFDVSGAGDTVIGVFTLALCCGASKLEAAHIANFAAGIVVGKVGTATTNKEELLQRLC